jgi:hypothetical protein
MIIEPGVDTTYRYVFAAVPDGGLRLNVVLGSAVGPSRLHHIDDHGVFFSHQSVWSADAGSLLAPLADLVHPTGFWSMRREQREVVWPAILRAEAHNAPLLLSRGYAQPDYDGYFATLSAEQRDLLSRFQEIFVDIRVDAPPDRFGGVSQADLDVMDNLEWFISHPDHRPAWFEPIMKRAATKGYARALVDPYVALRGDAAAAARICAEVEGDDRAIALFALTDAQCAKLVALARAPETPWGVWSHGGAPCTLEQARQHARERLSMVLPDELRVDGGVPVPSGCGAFLAALANQRSVPREVRLRYERLAYELKEEGEWCNSPLSRAFGLPANVTRKRFSDGSSGRTCEVEIDDRRRTVRAKGTLPPPPPEEPD